MNRLDVAHLGIGGATLDPLPGTEMFGDPHTWCPDIWQKLIDQYAVKSMIDIGGCLGATARWFLDRGIDAYLVEAFPPFVEKSYMPKERLFDHDYTEGPLPLDRTFDLCWSAEFVEHVEERFMANFLATFAACKYVCLTHAVPNQGGYHHVNEQPTEYWIDKMKGIGFTFHAEETAAMRATADWGYGRCTLTFFSKP